MAKCVVLISFYEDNIFYDAIKKFKNKCDGMLIQFILFLLLKEIKITQF